MVQKLTLVYRAVIEHPELAHTTSPSYPRTNGIMPAAVKEKAIQKVRAGMPDITEDQVTGDVKGKSFRLFTWTTNAKARKLLENCNLNVKIDFAFGQAGPGTLVNLFKTALTVSENQEIDTYVLS